MLVQHVLTGRSRLESTCKCIDLIYYKTAKNALVGEIRIDATANGQILNRPLTTNRPYTCLAQNKHVETSAPHRMDMLVVGDGI